MHLISGLKCLEKDSQAQLSVTVHSGVYSINQVTLWQFLSLINVYSLSIPCTTTSFLGTLSSSHALEQALGVRQEQTPWEWGCLSQASRPLETAVSEKTFPVLSDRAQTLHSDGTFLSEKIVWLLCSEFNGCWWGKDVLVLTANCYFPGMAQKAMQFSNICFERTQNVSSRRKHHSAVWTSWEWDFFRHIYKQTHPENRKQENVKLTMIL